MTLLRITSGRLTIRQAPQGTAPPLGLYVGRGGFTGWDDQPVTRRSTADRPNAHGEFDVPGFLSGRLISIDGWCIAESPDGLEKWRSKVTGHGADGSSFEVSVRRAGSTHIATARLAAGQQTTFVDNGTGRRAAFSMSWWCADPRRYEQQVKSDIPTPGAVIRIWNRGNFPSTPRLTVKTTVPLPGGYTITGPDGRQIIVVRALNPGSTHVVDLATGRLYENGTRVLRGFASLHLWAVPADSAVDVSVSGGQLSAVPQNVYV